MMKRIFWAILLCLTSGCGNDLPTIVHTGRVLDVRSDGHGLAAIIEIEEQWRLQLPADGAKHWGGFDLVPGDQVEVASCGENHQVTKLLPK